MLKSMDFPLLRSVFLESTILMHDTGWLFDNADGDGRGHVFPALDVSPSFPASFIPFLAAGDAPLELWRFA